MYTVDEIKLHVLYETKSFVLRSCLDSNYS